MAWVRLDDSALGNLKIVRLPDSALRLWLKGLCYCQMHLTDGLIPREALGPMEAKRKDIDSLCKAWVDGKHPLWEVVEGFGFKVHDYLEYNDSREIALKRKQADKERKAKARSDRESEQLSARTDGGNPHGFPLGGVKSSSSLEKEERELARRAGDFIERYVELYAKHRHGARWMRRKPHQEFPEACALVQTFDDARLEKLAVIFLTTDDDWISKTDRGFMVFASKASWCDDRLAQWEAAQKGRAS